MVIFRQRQTKSQPLVKTICKVEKVQQESLMHGWTEVDSVLNFVSKKPQIFCEIEWAYSEAFVIIPSMI